MFLAKIPTQGQSTSIKKEKKSQRISPNLIDSENNKLELEIK